MYLHRGSLPKLFWSKLQSASRACASSRVCLHPLITLTFAHLDAIQLTRRLAVQHRDISTTSFTLTSKTSPRYGYLFIRAFFELQTTWAPRRRAQLQMRLTSSSSSVSRDCHHGSSPHGASPSGARRLSANSQWSIHPTTPNTNTTRAFSIFIDLSHPDTDLD